MEELKMETIFVDIYEQYLDEMGLNVIENRRVMSSDYVIKSDIQTLENDIYRLIGTNKGDGFYVEIHSVGKYHFINIFLMVLEKCNIDYLKNYFELISEDTVIETEKISELNSNEEKYFLSIDYIHEEEMQEIINLIHDNDHKVELKSKEVVIFERGAGDHHINLLLEISTGIGGISGLITLGQFIKAKYNEHFREINMGKFNFEELIFSVSKITGVNYSSIYVHGFKVENDIVKVQLKSRYKDFEVFCNKELEIIEFNTLDKSQTMI